MAGGKAARNSGLTSVTPGPPSTGGAVEGRVVAAGGRAGGLMPSWFCSTSRRMSSGRAARKEGSTPSGRLMPAKTNIWALSNILFKMGKINRKSMIAIYFYLQMGPRHHCWWMGGALPGWPETGCQRCHFWASFPQVMRQRWSCGNQIKIMAIVSLRQNVWIVAWLMYTVKLKPVTECLEKGGGKKML